MKTPSIVSAERISLRASACTAAARIIKPKAQENVAPLAISTGECG
jgi:hypothetical protein